jgi:predicted CoA-binding protein
MTDPAAILRRANSILVVDWPSEDVPETLTRAGYTVVVKGGPGSDYSVYAIVEGEFDIRTLGHRPDRVDLVYAHRPIDELARLADLALELGATTIWLQSGLASDGKRDPTGSWMPDERSAEARGIVESAGLSYVERPYIADTVRAAGIRKASQ